MVTKRLKTRNRVKTPAGTILSDKYNEGVSHSFAANGNKSCLVLLGWDAGATTGLINYLQARKAAGQSIRLNKANFTTTGVGELSGSFSRQLIIARVPYGTSVINYYTNLQDWHDAIADMLPEGTKIVAKSKINIAQPVSYDGTYFHLTKPLTLSWTPKGEDRKALLDIDKSTPLYQYWPFMLIRTNYATVMGTPPGNTKYNCQLMGELRTTSTNF